MSDVQQQWKDKLLGKKYVEGEITDTSTETFSSNILPEKHRILKPDSMRTMNFDPQRVNVHVNDQKVCTDVTMG
ncbi:hypothetical protein EYZ11_000197 [Aspergillus tanneri]|uniref:Uncharacterized protein n=1 Tax=Aspergillus tanneri TaxID=1220188 RepID=A0A4S3JY47_9EURO|nr:hypothetical protein EYZ11_000197 [Aspergillus tanneri]